MAAIVLSLAVSVLVGASFWLLAGPRLPIHQDAKQNEVLNVFAYVAIVLPFVFAAVFLLIERM